MVVALATYYSEQSVVKEFQKSRDSAAIKFRDFVKKNAEAQRKKNNVLSQTTMTSK